MAVGLQHTLQVHHGKFGGVLNGIDYDVWNPEIDVHIPERYPCAIAQSMNYLALGCSGDQSAMMPQLGDPLLRVLTSSLHTGGARASPANNTFSAYQTGWHMALCIGSPVLAVGFIVADSNAEANPIAPLLKPVSDWLITRSPIADRRSPASSSQA
jgi:hypothetical protein